MNTTTSENAGYFACVWPRSPRQTGIKTLAPRPASLANKRIAFLWDFLFRGNEIFALLEEGLKARYPGIEFVGWKEFGNTHGSNEREVLAALPDKLKALRIDAVVSGMGC